MIARLGQWFGTLNERERGLVLIGAAAALVLLLIAVLLPLQRAGIAADQRIERKRADLNWLRAAAPQLAGMDAQTPQPPRESLVVLLDRSAREAGLEHALTGSQPSGDGGMRVQLEQTSFDTLVGWVAQLVQRYGVRVDSAVIEPGNAAGLVNATLVLRGR